METIKACQRIINSIFSNENGKSVQSILITSSVKGEGVSHIAASMGDFLAKYRHMKVCLVDASFTEPSLHKIFNLENDNGLINVIENPDTLNAMVRPTDTPNLSIITSGATGQEWLEALQLGNIQFIIQELKKKFDLVIFDSSAVSQNGHSLDIAPHVDGVILVVHAGHTRWEVVQDSRDQFEGVQAKLLGVVLNRRKFFIPSFLYRNL